MNNTSSRKPKTLGLVRDTAVCLRRLAGFGLTALILLAAPLLGQPAVSSVLNGASYALPGLPNGGVAQGSIFIVFGKNLGPVALAEVSKFPLPTSQGLAGTSIKVTVNGTTVDAIMLYTLSTQVAAVLPSSTPIGIGTLTLTYNGATSAAAPITVVKSAFGIFTLNQAGSGAGVLQNVNSQTDQPVNGPTKSAHPGQAIILWGTGLGPVSGNEAGGPLPGDMKNFNVQVWIGGKQASVQYRGRSGCCTGLDEIVFTLPAGLQGCNVSVYVLVDNVISNFATMSIAPPGSQCSDPGGLSIAGYQTLLKNGVLRAANLSVLRSVSQTKKGPQRADTVGAAFFKETFNRAQLPSGPPSLGSCVVLPIPGPVPAVSTVGLDAGKVSLTTPTGPYDVPPVPNYKGVDSLAFLPGSPANPNIVNDGTLLKPGTYTFNIAGGADVGAATASINFPLTFVWTNAASVTSINRSQPLTIDWSGGTSGASVNIEILSQVSAGVGAALLCYADATLGTFTIPSALLSALPASYSSDGIPQGSLSITEYFYGQQFAASGLDYGVITFGDTSGRGAMNIQ